MAYFDMFPEVLIELQREVLNHPLLIPKLQKHHDVDPELQFAKCIAEIALHVDVALDDHYTPEMILKICDILINRLKEKRKEIIITGSSGTGEKLITKLNPIAEDVRSSLILPNDFSVKH